jgi:hypothetical protein
MEDQHHVFLAMVIAKAELVWLLADHAGKFEIGRKGAHRQRRHESSKDIKTIPEEVILTGDRQCSKAPPGKRIALFFVAGVDSRSAMSPQTLDNKRSFASI